MRFDFKESLVRGIDPANREVVQRENTKTVRMMMFTNKANAAWIGSRILSRDGYGLATINFPANRKVFRLEVGDLFKLTYVPYRISNMVCRISRIREEDLETEDIIVDVIEDIDYLSNPVTLLPSSGRAITPDYALTPLTHVDVIETPYIMSGGPLEVIPLAAREKGTELGYYLYMSIDGGLSYTKIAVVPTYNPYGSLVAEYSTSTYTIDDDYGFQIDFSNEDVDIIQTIVRSQLFGDTNLALLGSEIVSFQTVTPVSGNRYIFSGINRGRFDTKKVDHSIGESFFFTGSSNFRSIRHDEIVAGASRKFKIVPYSSKYMDEIADASVISLDIGGRAKKPYIPINFLANGSSYASRYSDDITLTWSPRYRSKGAGIGTPGVVLADTLREGLFEIEVWVSGSKVRTASDIDAVTWTYTEAMNIEDNDPLADEVTFKILNYRVEGGVTYSSDQESVVCKKN